MQNEKSHHVGFEIRLAISVASSGHWSSTVTRLIEAGCSVDEKDEEDHTPLYPAALRGHVLVVDNCSIEEHRLICRGGYCSTALQAASYSGDEAVVQLLLKEGADVETQGGYYGNALQAASLGGQSCSY